MKRKLKVLGLAALAVFALSAVIAGAAQAATFTTTDANYPVALSGTQISGTVTLVTFTHNEFSVDGGTTNCTAATFFGTSGGAASSTQRLAASYGGCKLFGLFNATVNMHGCGYLFHLSSATTATADIEGCEAGKEIEISSGITSCVVTVPAQNGLGGITLANENSGTTTSIVTTFDITGVHYHENSSCPGGRTAEGTNGIYKGVATISAKFNGASEGIMTG
ncbi:MAG TPA: hypothetical protein VHS74_03075 [Solirubrobacterales bacterium]|jgi:hypothetical protein|nr:hypothetical protein [Solirubrobacterales bacterium]